MICHYFTEIFHVIIMHNARGHKFLMNAERGKRSFFNSFLRLFQYIFHHILADGTSQIKQH